MKLLLFILSLNCFTQSVNLKQLQYHYLLSKSSIELKQTFKIKKFRHFKGELTTEDPIHKSKVLKAPFQFFKVSDDAPTVFLFPAIAGTLPPIIEQVLAVKFAKNGYNAVIVELVEDIYDLSRKVEEIDYFLKRSTISFGLLKSMLIKEGLIHPSELFAAGTSLGGIRASFALSVDKDIKKAFVWVAGGDLPQIMTNSEVKVIADLRDTKMKEYGLKSKSEYHQLLNKHIKIKPMDFAHLRSREDIFMVLASDDHLVPTINQFKLLHAFGYPKYKLIQGGHRRTGSDFMFDFKSVIEFFQK